MSSANTLKSRSFWEKIVGYSRPDSEANSSTLVPYQNFDISFYSEPKVKAIIFCSSQNKLFDLPTRSLEFRTTSFTWKTS